MTWEERNPGVKIIYNQRDGSTVCYTVSLTKPTANNLLRSVTEIMIDLTDYLHHFVIFAQSILIPCFQTLSICIPEAKLKLATPQDGSRLKKLGKLNTQITYAF